MLKIENTLYTGPKPPSPILKLISKFLVAALIFLMLNKPVWKSTPINSVETEEKHKYVVT